MRDRRSKNFFLGHVKIEKRLKAFENLVFFKVRQAREKTCATLPKKGRRYPPLHQQGGGRVMGFFNFLLTFVNKKLTNPVLYTQVNLRLSYLLINKLILSPKYAKGSRRIDFANIIPNKPFIFEKILEIFSASNSLMAHATYNRAPHNNNHY